MIVYLERDIPAFVMRQWSISQSTNSMIQQQLNYSCQGTELLEKKLMLPKFYHHEIFTVLLLNEFLIFFKIMPAQSAIVCTCR